MTWILNTLVLFLGLLFAVAVAALVGAFFWRRRTLRLRGELEATRRPVEPTTYDASELQGLPRPVRRYFESVLEPGQGLVAAVTIRHAGEFNLEESGERWAPLRSSQRSVSRPPGFLWDARIRPVPGMSVFVHDAYVGTEGHLRARLLGLLTLTEQPPSPELARGELMRFLAEAAWYPTAFLPSQGVVWEPLDDTSARASLVDGSTEVTLTVRFDHRGLIDRVRAEDRPRLVDGGQVPTPWEGRFSTYERRSGMLIPLEAEVGWSLPEGWAPYWRGRIVQIEHDLAT